MEKIYNKNQKKNYNKQVIFLSLLLVMSEVIDAEIFLFVITLYLSMMTFKVGIIKKALKINIYLISIFIIGFTVGIIQLAINSYDIRDFFRDMSRFLTPIIFITYGIYLRFNKKVNIKKIYISIINAAIIIEIRHLLLIFFNMKNIINGLSIRGIGGNGSYITMIAIIILLFYKDNDDLYYFGTRIKKYTIITCLLTLFISYLSRTHLIIFLIGITINIFITRKIRFKKVVSCIIYILILSVIGLIIIPENTLNQFINKFSNSINEISANSEQWNELSINNNWRGYEVYRTKELFKEVNSKELLFGFGFGKRVDLNTGIYLGDQKFYSIPILHNGYYYILLKSGIFGLIIYITFTIKIILRNYNKIYNDDFESKLLCIIGISILFTTYVVTGIYNRGSMFVFCLIIAMSFYDINKNNYVNNRE
ncbi:Lipid A core-O-antigen ligase and related enzymes [[Clostridium] sordellii]|uniref:O-antigen ligase family protein n=1 Tax=Paraclostridium sordellii TaxID=1505 RepID=UPI0005E8658B|nr:O-antigen ligase family protein [Paeniclostridium sordellii]CEQ31481.1 Lipid A core-O-antigen ligase and related enzymes [[Clostridium] sordellii] [Paeniclostridium sordellii]